MTIPNTETEIPRPWPVIDERAAVNLPRAFVGALLQVSTSMAAHYLERVADSDLGDDRLIVVMRTVRRLVAQNRPHDHAAVLVEAMTAKDIPPAHEPAAAALLGELVAWESCPTPLHIAAYARGVVDQAARRDISAAATRLQAAVDGPISLDLLTVTEREIVSLSGAVARLRGAP